MITNVYLTYYKKFDDEWYEKTITLKDLDSLVETINSLNGVYTFKIKVSRSDSSK